MTTSIIRDSFRYSNLKKFTKSLNGSDSLYIGIGRPQYWNTTNNVDSVDLSSGDYSPKNTLLSTNNDRKDLMSLKRVTFSDVSFGISKLMWTAGKKYDIYRHDYSGQYQSVYDSLTYPSSLSMAKYVVLTSSFDIFICIRQGKIGGVVVGSVYSPTTGVAVGVGTNTFKTADGYYWKFIGKTDTGDYSRFSSITHHPVKTLTVQPQVSDTYYNQWVAQIESAQFKAGIYNIEILSSGTGYNGGNSGIHSVTDAETDPLIRVYGDGTGIQFSVTYGSGGSIVDIEITNPGTGYTYASITTLGGGAGFTPDIIFTQRHGLGADPEKDTSALFLLASTTLNSDESGKFTTDNDFRKICLISNPVNYGTNIVSTMGTGKAMQTLSLTSIVGGTTAFSPDDIIVGSTSQLKARVVDFNGVDMLRYIVTGDEGNIGVNSNNLFLVGESVSVDGGTGSATVSEIIPPDIDPFSGEIIYSEYRQPTLRQLGNTENIRLIVEF